MNVAKTAAYLFLPLAVVAMGSGEIWGQSAGPGKQWRQGVSRDTETRVGSAAKWRHQEGSGQCSPNGIPVLELVTPPKHGTVRFVTTDVGVPKGSGCVNSICGQAVFYRPDSGFVGRDQFTYSVPAEPTAFNWLGSPPGTKTVILSVGDRNQRAPTR
jgi:hypothetical protein